MDYTALHLVDLPHALLNQLSDELAGVPIDEDDPLVDQELLRPEFDFDCLKHLYGLYDVGEHLLGHCGIVYFEKKQAGL